MYHVPLHMSNMAPPMGDDSSYAPLNSGRSMLSGAGSHMVMSGPPSARGPWGSSSAGASSMADAYNTHRLHRLEHEIVQMKGRPLTGNTDALDGRGRLDRLELELERMRQTQFAPASPQHGMHPMSFPAAQPQIMPVPMPMPMPMMGGPPAAPTGPAGGDLLAAHQQLIGVLAKTNETHTELMKAHTELMQLHTRQGQQPGGSAPGAQSSGGGGGGAPGSRAAKKQNPKLGVIRLDYNYPPAAGDIDCPASYGYDVIYRVVPGLTFDKCQSGRINEDVERQFAEGIKYLESRGANAITGDCGFMMSFQVLARKIATKPIFMSSMCQCPVIGSAFDLRDEILILTANSATLKPQKDVLLNECGFDVNEDRFKIIGCQDVPGFDAVAKGEKVDVERVQPGVVKLVKDTMRRRPNVKAILLECTELPPYADALRAATSLPVWDAITGADFYISAFSDNPRFGIDDWQEQWDGTVDEYTYGQNLREGLKAELVNKIPGSTSPAKKKLPKKRDVEKTVKRLKKKQNPILGVVRLDYNYPPAAGDIDCPGSYGYEVLFRVVPGMTFEMCQSGKMSFKVQEEFKAAVRWLEGKGANAITGDCGFMMAFQPVARDVATVPVFMSAMVQCPMVSVAFDRFDKIMILTANGQTLKPQKETLLKECGFKVDDDRFVIYGCQDVPGFDAVAKGEAVDVARVTPGIVQLASQILDKNPTIRAIVLECTELPAYADALRKSTRLPVFDAITCADFFINAFKDNPRFGLNQWQSEWDGVIDDYKFGDNLTAEERSRVLSGR